MGNRELVVQTESLTKRYGRVLALDGLSLDVRAGEVLGFLGPNGAGKTTTMARRRSTELPGLLAQYAARQ